MKTLHKYEDCVHVAFPILGEILVALLCFGEICRPESSRRVIVSRGLITMIRALKLACEAKLPLAGVA